MSARYSTGITSVPVIEFFVYKACATIGSLAPIPVSKGDGDNPIGGDGAAGQDITFCIQHHHHARPVKNGTVIMRLTTWLMV